ncbi:MAG: type I-C CRISPR-associated protein Cas8c/Csd1 [Prevotella sp.]|nr:type I-C CRISPR-associated protein Cas8c/Csd1 [Prevotella sp.]
MILKALYDYYNRCSDLPPIGMEEKEIGFLIVLSPDGRFVRFEDCRIGKNHARAYLVKKHVGRSSGAVANYLYDNGVYVLGYSEKNTGKEQSCFDTFKAKIEEIVKAFPDNKDLSAIKAFYENSRETIIQTVSQDPLWEDIKKNLSKKYSIFSFRIDGDTKIVAEKKEILQFEENDGNATDNLCLITGSHGPCVDTTTATMIPGSQATAKLVAFQINSGYDSYGKTKCGNAPISEKAEFAYTTALNSMLQHDSRNKFRLGTRTFVFWASNDKEASKEAEESLFELLGYSEEETDDPNAHLIEVRKVFESIYSGVLSTGLDDKFYILGLAPNSARIAVIYWSETTLKDFAEKILRHFSDMEINDTRKNKKPYMGVRDIISSVTHGGKMSDATPNLPEAVVKSIFQGLPYPATLYAACIRRIRAEQELTITRAAILKAYLNRINNNPLKIGIMLDKGNNNQGYLCGRLFAVLDKIQYEANNISSIRERYMNAASATPSSVFATILNLSVHHAEKLDEGRRIYFEKLKQEIFEKMSANGFPTHLDLQDQGRFFVGYYHQRQDLFASKKEQ